MNQEQIVLRTVFAGHPGTGGYNLLEHESGWRPGVLRT